MPEPIDLNHPDVLLSAFADGELNAPQRLAALQYLSAHPEAAAKAASAARFRQAVGRVMEQAPAAPAALRIKVGRLATAVPADDAPVAASGSPAASAADDNDWSGRHTTSRWFIGRAVPLAAAASVAFLLLGLWAGRNFLGKPDSDQTITQRSPVPLTLVTAATLTHVDCSRMPSLHVGSWPQALGDLGAPLTKYLGRPVPYPDLSPIGYEYLGSGACDKPLENAAHVLYKAKDPSVNDTISLFVQKDAGRKVPVEVGKVYRVTDKNSPHPMIVWRHDDMVFYLVGNAEQPVDKAAKQIGIPAPL